MIRISDTSCYGKFVITNGTFEEMEAENPCSNALWINKSELIPLALALLKEAGATVCKAGHISSHHSNIKGELQHNFDIYESERDAHRCNKVGTINPGDTVVIIPAERRGEI